MKTVKFALPVLAFLFAMVASFASSNDATPTVVTRYYFDANAGLCRDFQIDETNLCNGSGSICKIVLTGVSFPVYADRTATPPTTACANILLHSGTSGIVTPQ